MHGNVSLSGFGATKPQHYNKAMDAIRAGDWTAFGTEMKALGDELSKPSDSDHP
jgi:hypothetical protein